jgi:ketosteroid isomerase-like protein
MNEQNNKALVEKMYAAFGRGDVRTILDHLTPNVEWTLEGPSVIPFAGKRIGPAQVHKFFEALATT